MNILHSLGYILLATGVLVFGALATKYTTELEAKEVEDCWYLTVKRK